MPNLTKINPSKKREIITANASTVHVPPFRAISVDVSGTVTVQSVENGEASAVAVYVAAGVIHPMEFDKLTAVSGPTSVVGHR